MPAPEAPHTAFDTLLMERALARLDLESNGQNQRTDSLSVITTDPVTGVRTEVTLDSEAPELPTAPNGIPVQLRKRFTELDGLRGAAALLVVVFHLSSYIQDLGPPRPLTLLIRGGYLMVDLFFVLSGFVLARSMLDTWTPRDVFRFGSLRARRFLPLHLTGLAIAFGCVAVTWLTQHYGYQHAPHRPAFSSEQQSPWAYLSSALLLQGFIGPHFAGYAAAWSLSIELWTNILLVIAIAAVPWGRRKLLVGPIAAALGIAILFTVGRDGSNSIGWVAFARGLTGLGVGMTIFWAFTVGARRGWGRSARWPAVGALLGLLALGACLYFQRDLRPLHFLPAFAVAAWLIFCLVQPSTGPAQQLLNSRLAQWLGSRSFALYVLHGPVRMTIVLACRLRHLDLHNPKVAVFIIVTTVIGALAAAEIGHRFIERIWVPKKTG
ncbi:MAG TPA: acyltransferase [Kineosporiaceae bacterium]|nr:acyltransferase [Kineosporiaceae bacterium]